MAGAQNAQEYQRPIQIRDEGIVIATNIGYLDFTGPAAAGSALGGNVTETFNGAGTGARVVALTDAATVTPNADITDIGILSSLSQTTFFANPSGTPVNGQKLEFRITSSAVRAMSFGAGYNGSLLPTSSSGGGLTDYIGLKYNGITSKWDCLAVVLGI